MKAIRNAVEKAGASPGDTKAVVIRRQGNAYAGKGLQKSLRMPNLSRLIISISNKLCGYHQITVK